MIGLVLCGGQSSRMGSDKGLLKSKDKTWAQTAIDKLAILKVPIMISVNLNQYNDYASVFTTSPLIVDNNTLQLRGPLLGVLSAHLQKPSEDIFAFACDMPFMEPSFLKELYYQYQQQQQYDAFVFTTDDEAEPLCGIYTAKALASILAMYHTKQLTKHSMKFMLEHLSVCSIPVTDDQKKYFRNINAHAELNGL